MTNHLQPKHPFSTFTLTFLTRNTTYHHHFQCHRTKSCRADGGVVARGTGASLGSGRSQRVRPRSDNTWHLQLRHSQKTGMAIFQCQVDGRTLERGDINVRRASSKCNIASWPKQVRRCPPNRSKKTRAHFLRHWLRAHANSDKYITLRISCDIIGLLPAYNVLAKFSPSRHCPHFYGFHFHRV